MSTSALTAAATGLVASPRGILAADESPPTMGRRLAAHHIDSTEFSRREWRELLITTRDLHRWISGVILHEETASQITLAGERFPAAITARGMVPGIKVDQGTIAHADHGETITHGLDGLPDRLERYRELGLRFAKWRAVIRIDEQHGLPTRECIHLNVDALARYAACCQQAGLVPIVEPEVLMDGEHSIERCDQVTREVLAALFEQLDRQQVLLDATVLKPNMILPGSGHRPVPCDEEIACATLAAVHATAPDALAGIAFLSGGQTPDQATSRLREINERGRHPWPLTFSYGRALQQEALAVWRGEIANTDQARVAFARRAQSVSRAAEPTTQTVAGEATL